MSFSYRMNTEVLYYQNAVHHIRLALSAYAVQTLDKNYGCDNETTYEEVLPSDKKSLNHAIQSVINFACCAESCYNLSINEYCRRSDIDEILRNKLLRLPVQNKIRHINIFYLKIIPNDLEKNLVLLARVRNQLVHYSEPISYCGGRVMGEQFHLLRKENIVKFQNAVDALIAILHQNRVLDSDIRCPSAPVIGNGDIVFE